MMSGYTYLNVMRVCVCPLSHTRNLWGVFKGHNQIKVSSGINVNTYMACAQPTYLLAWEKRHAVGSLMQLYTAQVGDCMVLLAFTPASLTSWFFLPGAHQ